MEKTNNSITQINLGGVNSYLIRTEDGYVLADTGGHLTMDKTFDNRRTRLTETLTSAGCMKGNLRLVLLTHGDNDHVANARFIREEFGTPIAMHPGDLPLVESPTMETMMGSFNTAPLCSRRCFILLKKK